MNRALFTMTDADRDRLRAEWKATFPQTGAWSLRPGTGWQPLGDMAQEPPEPEETTRGCLLPFALLLPAGLLGWWGAFVLLRAMVGG